MSLNNDYMIQLLAHERHAELLAEAANARLARMARASRDPWWRHPLQAAGEQMDHTGGREAAARTVVNAAR
jgi:hypothetical protein